MAFIEEIPCTLPVARREHRRAALGLGVVGLHEGRTLLMAAATRCAGIRPVAGCDLSPEKRDAAARELPGLLVTDNYDAMLARGDVQVVAIYTPDALHAEHVVRAFEAGKHVICTKPLTNSLEGAARILAAGRRSGRKLLVGQSTRFFEPFRRQRAQLERDELGGLAGIELVDAHYVHRMDWYYRKSPWTATDTDWIFLGLSHPIDLVRWYLGPIDEVHCYGSTSAMGRGHGLAGRDIYTVNLQAADGRVGRVMGHYGLHELPRARNSIECVIYASGGTSMAQYHDMKLVWTGRPEDPMTEFVEDHLYAGRHYYFNSEVHGMHYGEFANYADYFAEALLDGRPYAPDLEEGVETYCVMEAVRQSATHGQPVAVGPLLQEVGLAPAR